MINIVTVVFNQLDYLKYCVDYLYKNTEAEFHHTIVDQASSDGTQEWLKQFGKSDFILFDHNEGVSYAQNLVWLKYPDEHYLKLDPDLLVFDRGWLKAMLKIAEENTTLVGCLGLNVENIHYEAGILSDFPVEFKGGNIGGACCFIPNYIHNELGFWNVLNKPYGEEDALMGLRILLSGRKNIYLESFRAMHLPNADFNVRQEDPIYRKFKDDCRRENLKGEYSSLVGEYHEKIRKLKVDFKVKDEHLHYLS